MMRTTINLDDRLLTLAKEEALRSHRTLGQVIADALSQALTRGERLRNAPRTIDLPIVAGQGLQPGVDLDSSTALLDILERDAAG